MVADELARWGDWKNATWIWESVLVSRPYIVAIMTNVARGYPSMGNTDKAMEYLERAKKIQPTRPGGAVAGGDPAQPHRTGGAGAGAGARGHRRQASSTTTWSTPPSSWPGGRATTRWLRRRWKLRMTAWPASRAEGHVQLGNMYAPGAKDPDKALAAFKQAMALRAGSRAAAR